MKRVLVATPTKSGIPAYWVRGWESVMREPIPGFDCTFVIEDAHQAINLSRNAIAHGAMNGGYDINVMVDADHPWTRGQLERLLSHEEPIVSGLYAKKCKGDALWLGLKEKGAVTRPDGLIEASHLPTGFLKVDVAAYRKIGEAFPKRRYVFTTDDGKDHEAFDLFPIGLVGPNTAEARWARLLECVNVFSEKKALAVDFAQEVLNIVNTHSPEPARLLGEDYFFCHLARKAGFKLWLDTKCVVPHMGQAAYPITEAYLPTKATDIPTCKVDLSGW